MDDGRWTGLIVRHLSSPKDVPLDHLGSYAWHSLSSEKRVSPPHPSHVKRLLERIDEVGELGRLIRWASGREP